MPGNVSRTGAAWLACGLAAALVLAPRSSLAQTEALRNRVDAAISIAPEGYSLELCSDAEFLRRVSLDLIGTIPTAAEARAFLEDTSPDKRETLVDRLLTDPRYARHLADVFDVMLMERRSSKHVKADEWHGYLQASLRENKPLDQLAREILAADGVDPAQRAPARFYLDRDVEPHLLTRDTGRIFFGRDMQCNQCHDHPHIDDYLQADYFGLFAFLSRSYAFQDKAAKVTVVAEKGEGVVSFESVFDSSAKGETRPKLPLGEQTDEPEFAKGEEYEVKPGKDVRPIPKYSRRARLAAEATSGQSEAFNRNFANRLWAHMMGRGLVEPLDLHHSENPPTHPELLDELARELVALKFDVRAMLRELALTRTYQRKLDLPDRLAGIAQAAVAEVPDAEARQKQLAEAAGQAAESLQKADAEVQAARDAAGALVSQVAQAESAAEEAGKQALAAAETLAAAQQELAAEQKKAALLAEAAAKASQALEQLPGDEDVALAAGKLDGRARQLAAQVEQLAKTVAGHAADKDQKDKALAAARQQATQAASMLSEAQKNFEAATARHQETASSARTAGSAVAGAAARLASLRSFAHYAEALNAADASRAAVARFEQQLAAARDALAKQKGVLEQAGAAFAAAESAQRAADDELAKTRQAHAARQEIASSVAAAATGAEEARGKLPDDETLAQAAAQLKSKAEQLAGEVAELEKAVSATQSAAEAAAARRAAAEAALQAAASAMAETEKQQQTLGQQLHDAKQQVEAGQAAVAEAGEALSTHCADRFLAGSLKPLTPEQMTWSILQAVGQVEAQRAAARAEVEKKHADQEGDPAEHEVAAEVEQIVYDRLKGHLPVFVGLFGGGAGQPQDEFFATIDQALFFANGSQLQSWLAASGGNLTDRLAALEDDQALAEELYLSVLTRLPSEEETAEVARHLASRGAEQRSSAVQEMVWGLLTSAEFRFNY